MQILKYFLFGSLTITSLFAVNIDTENLKWGDLEVVWLEDNTYPTFSVQIYFSDGALSDQRDKEGETSLMFDNLTSGTNRFTQKEIKDNLEFYGISYGSSTFHEYSTFSFSGLNKDLIPVTKKFCHLFNDSVFPKREIRSAKKRMTSGLQNLVTDHSGLASRALRQLTMKGTPFEKPTEGTLKSIPNINSRDLRKKLNYFNDSVSKKIYLRGSRSILTIKDIITKECGWDGTQKYVREFKGSLKPRLPKTKIVLVPVKNANQAQIRIGKTLGAKDIVAPDLLNLSSSFLGGGFISILNQELRVKRGLTYTVSAIAQAQKYYGRSIIMTFSRNDKVAESINVIKDVLKRTREGEISEEGLQTMKNYLAGSHLFQFESNDSFLRNLMLYDHVERNWSELFNFPKAVKAMEKKSVAYTVGKIFDESDSVIVVVGNKNLLNSLKKVATTQIIEAKSFL